jgi:dephospho-CoA kinase
MMLVVGLTGSIAMGKSTAAAFLRSRGVPVFDADAAVHDIYRGEAVPLIEAAFPGSTDYAGVNRERLSAALKSAPDGHCGARCAAAVRDRPRRST